MSKKKVTSQIYSLKTDAATVPVSNANLPEDAFAGRYWDGAGGNILEPPYPFAELEQLVECNSTIRPCVAAYRVNIDGTGYVLENPDSEPIEAPVFQDLFAEISPGKTLLTLRQDARDTLEITGNAFLEVVRNRKNEIQFINLLPTASMRLVRLGEPVIVKRNFRRNGVTTTLTYSVRERAYVQDIGSETVYFREFGATQEINKNTGKWVKGKLPPQTRGSEVIHFTVNKAANSPYGVPRWINHTPSVVGQREAEEFAMQTVSSGGMNALLMIIKNASINSRVQEQVKNINGTRTTDKQGQVLVLELEGDMGGMEIGDKATPSSADVHKFGADSSKDPMYKDYAITTRENIMMAFRLHKMYVGLAENINRATAEEITTLTEAQVFRPERDEFDEIWNMRIMRSIDPTGGVVFRSKPVVLRHTEDQIKALTLAKDHSGVGQESWVNAVNDILGSNLTYEELIPIDEQQPEELAKSFLTEDADQSKILTLVKSELTEAEQTRFWLGLVKGTYSGAHHDPQGSVELIKCECGC